MPQTQQHQVALYGWLCAIFNLIGVLSFAVHGSFVHRPIREVMA